MTKVLSINEIKIKLDVQIKICKKQSNKDQPNKLTLLIYSGYAQKNYSVVHTQNLSHKEAKNIPVRTSLKEGNVSEWMSNCD